MQQLKIKLKIYVYVQMEDVIWIYLELIVIKKLLKKYLVEHYTPRYEKI